MKMKRFVLIVSCFLFLFCLYSAPVFANKAAITLEGPASAEKGSEVTIKITVAHSANSFIHYTKWLKVQADGKPIEQWDFTARIDPMAPHLRKRSKSRCSKTQKWLLKQAATSMEARDRQN